MKDESSLLCVARNEEERVELNGLSWLTGHDLDRLDRSS